MSQEIFPRTRSCETLQLSQDGAGRLCRLRRNAAVAHHSRLSTGCGRGRLLGRFRHSAQQTGIAAGEEEEEVTFYPFLAGLERSGDNRQFCWMPYWHATGCRSPLRRGMKLSYYLRLPRFSELKRGRRPVVELAFPEPRLSFWQVPAAPRMIACGPPGMRIIIVSSDFPFPYGLSDSMANPAGFSTSPMCSSIMTAERNIAIGFTIGGAEFCILGSRAMGRLENGDFIADVARGGESQVPEGVTRVARRPPPAESTVVLLEANRPCALELWERLRPPPLCRAGTRRNQLTFKWKRLAWAGPTESGLHSRRETQSPKPIPAFFSFSSSACTHFTREFHHGERIDENPGNQTIRACDGLANINITLAQMPGSLSVRTLPMRGKPGFQISFQKSSRDWTRTTSAR
jgi:hypothetical protein